ncbi:hypothetical protein Y032_0167g141 [Ancylostoma ceylanicum]|uniref:Integrase catalytic domain-containing protein n=1 Tax=Ancylostoma ceylanicum TaxID=53326 RepID=A0A016SVS1_9BILA|nr:hypothetical protein Y032_0167g141 [Ancylostoma ceylanicum]
MIEMSNISASRTVKALKSLFAREGLPQTIVSDNGTQFTSEQFKAMCDEGGIVRIKTAPYHPQSNGQAERFVDTLKRGIKKLLGKCSMRIVLSRRTSYLLKLFNNWGNSPFARV